MRANAVRCVTLKARRLCCAMLKLSPHVQSNGLPVGGRKTRNLRHPVITGGAGRR